MMSSSVNDKNLRLLEKTIDYQFKNRDRLHAALTHSSTQEDRNYERLEFLGDRILGLVIAEWLFKTFPHEKEGDLAKRHAVLVQGRTLAKMARRINLGDALNVSDAERISGGGNNDNILADALEALIGALYLDSSLEQTQSFIRDLWGDTINVMIEPPQDAKTALQEWAQGRGLPLPTYEMTDREGPDHAPVFTIKVHVKDNGEAQATGSSRRKAEKKAAKALLEFLAAQSKP